MFTEMRRKDRQLTQEEALEILKTGAFGVLATLGENGYPYGVPLSYAYDDGKIYFHGTSAVSLKDANISFHPQVSFTVVGKTEVLPSKFGTKYESVIVFGTIKKSDDKLTALHKLLEKYSADFLSSGEKFAQAATARISAYVLEIEHITGKARYNG